MPIRQSSAIVQPWRIAWWPMVTRAPMVSGKSGVAVADRAVLEVGLLAQDQRRVVAAQHRSEPDARARAQRTSPIRSPTARPTRPPQAQAGSPQVDRAASVRLLEAPLTCEARRLTAQSRASDGDAVARIFLSYAREDIAAARAFAAALERPGTRSGGTTSCAPARVSRGTSMPRSGAPRRLLSCGRRIRSNPPGCRMKRLRGWKARASSRSLRTESSRRSVSGNIIRWTCRLAQRRRAFTGSSRRSKRKCRERRRARHRRPEARASAADDLRPPLREQERRSRAGLFQRRHHRGRNHRPLENLRAFGHRPRMQPRPQGRHGRPEAAGRELGVTPRRRGNGS